MIRVVQMVGILQKAGMETFLMDVYRNIDRNKVQFDFIVHGQEVHEFEHEIEAMGGKVHHIARKTEGFFKHYADLRRVVKENNYKIIVRGTENAISALDLLAAKAGGARHLIAHSHNGLVISKKSKITNMIGRPLINMISTEKYACSTEAGKWLFGNGKFEIINNGRDLNVFTFDRQVRENTRVSLALAEDDFAVVSVARFFPQKNHRRIISIFAELKNQNPKAKLLLAGTGPLENEIRSLCTEMKVEDSVLFLGVRSDVSEILQASDAFLMPSLYEGLPLTVVEAQATGLPCFLSDTITREVDISDCVKFISLDQDDQHWAEKVNKASKNTEKRGPRTADCRKAGFDIVQTAKMLEQHYLELSQ